MARPISSPAQRSSSPLAPSAPPMRVARAHAVLSVLGIAAGAYAVIEHNRAVAGMSTGCGISETISCDKVLGSQYGAFFGIPLGYYGMLFWGLMLVLSFAGANTSPRAAALQRLALASVGLVTSLGLAYLSLVVIGKFCPVCATTHTLSGINFLVAAWNVWKLRSVPELPVTPKGSSAG